MSYNNEGLHNNKHYIQEEIRVYCKNCGFQMADDHLVCQNCGTKKGEGSAFCDQCGTVINVNSAFCTNCGKKIQVAATAGNVQNNQSAQFNPTPYSQQTPAQQFNSQAQQPNSQYLPPKKYCRNCGSEVLNSQVICTKCGVKIGEGSAHCPHCGAATQPGAEYCLSCGKGLKTPFNIGKYFSEFGDNFVSVFKNPDKKAMIFDNVINFAAVLIFIIMLLPTVTISALYLSYSYNTFGVSAFAGILLILSLLTAAMKYEPFSIKFMESKPQLAKFYVFLTPALELISFIIILINFFSAKSYAVWLYGSYVSVNFTFFGWLLMILILASVGFSIYLFITNNKKNNVTM